MESNISEFYKKNLEERLAIVKEFAQLSEEETLQLKKFAALDFEQANRMIENVVAVQQLPLGIATNFRINKKDYLVPMALEEPSVVAAASKAAQITRASEGFEAKASEPLMIGQIQVTGIKKPEEARKKILKAKKELLEKANSMDQTLVKFGGGAKKLEARVLKTIKGKMLIVELLVDVRDAMGANAINTMCEAITPKIEEITSGKVLLRIISNLAVYRTVKAKAVFSKKALEESFRESSLKGEEIVEAILNAYAFAEADVFRACTHNKGIMNGIDAVAIATGQDWRAIEAGAHTFACWKNKGKYKPLTKYYKDKEGNLVGEIELPLAVGLVGGATKSHPIAKIAVKILGVKSAGELAEIMACVGLANNIAAMRVLATEGVQRGHMKLHAKNIAVLAGAKGKQIDEVAEKMISEKNIKVDRAKEILEAKQNA
ncbi:MAG: hydroxymethylglutaryl-CoA reductase, degradative [Candidatus ainarchaeum sp.]|nr:hydroxymethylglutaryl-CoA reductase, degradative [Candidatus ainarchaeum sp.]